MTEQARTAESQVKQACTFLWGSLLFAGFSIYASIREGQMQLTFQIVLTLAFVGLFYAWLTIKIWRGRNWARVTYLVTSIVGLPLNLPIVAADFSANPVMGLLTAVSVFLPFLAFFLIFTSPGKNWFLRPASLAAESSPTHIGDPSIRLSQLKELHASGLITDEEFANKKANILAEF